MRAFIGASAVAIGCAFAAQGSVIIDLGGGWQAEILDEENVALEVDFVSLNQNLLVLEKFANFVQFAPHEIIFSQNRPDSQTVSRIVITEEFIANNTGIDWSFFGMSLVPSGGTLEATFDPAASADFSIEPFTSKVFLGSDTAVLFSGGVVADGEIWTPGMTSGGLVIDVDLSSSDPVSFTLLETPIPAPGGAGLLVAAGLCGRRRRRA